MGADSPTLCLASASPRRLELLASIGVVPDAVRAADIDETPGADELAVAYVERMAEEKARAVKGEVGQALVLGADTAVVVGGEILGKPRDRDDFMRMFALLAGREHRVISAVSLYDRGGVQHRCRVETRVSLRRISPAELDAYWASGEPCDKAGGYAIQGRGALFVERIDGSYSAVVGLPLYETGRLLSDAGLALWRV